MVSSSHNMHHVINSTDEDGQDEYDDNDGGAHGSIEGSESSGTHGKLQLLKQQSKSIKKKIGVFSKSPKIIPSLPP